MSSSILPALQNVLTLLFDCLLGTGGNLAPRCTVGGSLSNVTRPAIIDHVSANNTELYFH